MKFPLSYKPLRLALGLSQQDMADLLDVNFPTYTLAERNLRRLPAQSLLRLDIINKILAELPSLETEPPLPDLEFRVSELEHQLRQSQEKEKKLAKQKKEKETHSQSQVLMGQLLRNFDRLSEWPSSDPGLDSAWKAAMENRNRPEDPKKAWRFSVNTRIEAACQRSEGVV